MSKDHFQHKESERIVKVIDDVAHRHSGRGRVFDDFLTMTVCALAGQTREAEYLETIKPYIAGEKGKRDVDKLARLFGQLVDAMETTGDDILGDVHQGGITYGEHGQFFTPDPICELMSKLVADPEPDKLAKRIAKMKTERDRNLFSGMEEKESNGVKMVCDPCCGSGRMLLNFVKNRQNCYLVGQDVDHRCAKMTAINLGLRNLRGEVVWGNSLTLERKRVYHTGFNGRGVIRVEELQ